ncbi:MAG: hypothetical protein L0956_06725 [Candidatus Mariimomonas ferrooxydans]
MKTFKWLLIVVTAVSFIAGVSYTTWSGDQPSMPKESPDVPWENPVLKDPILKDPLYMCPTGWHLDSGSFKPNQTTTCVPNKPSSIKCPSGTDPFIGDCAVGCQKIIT